MTSPAQQEELVSVLDLNIGERDPGRRSLILLEMADTQRTEFRGKTTRRKSIDRIFGKIRTLSVAQVNKTQLRGLPRRSLVSDIDRSWLAQPDESDDETQVDTPPEDNVVPMLDLKIGEQDPRTNPLVLLEMQDTQKTGFSRKATRKKSIDRIFAKHRKLHLVHEFDRSRLRGLPRRSLASNIGIGCLVTGNESDDDDIVQIHADNGANLLDLNIGETDPATKSLVVLEMKDTQKTGFKKTTKRKDSIDRIFAKTMSFKMETGLDQRRLSVVPRRSLARDFEFGALNEPSESDGDD